MDDHGLFVRPERRSSLVVRLIPSGDVRHHPAPESSSVGSREPTSLGPGFVVEGLSLPRLLLLTDFLER